ncbi:MAG: protein translocase subunit SecD [Halanaerobiaceae bacterium]
MNFKQKRLLRLGIIAVLIVFSLFMYFDRGINLGLDLAGGSHILLEPDPEEDREVSTEDMQGVRDVIERRVNQLGLSEAVVQLQGDNRLIVELPAVEDPDEAIETIGRTAMISFRNPEGEEIMTGEHIKNAEADRNQNRQAIVHLEFGAEGSRIMERETRKIIEKEEHAKYLERQEAGFPVGDDLREELILSIYLDDELLHDPVVHDVISDQGQISGYDSLEAASEHAVLIREGALPVKLEVAEQRTVSATLGEMSLYQSIIAGLIGLAFVACYMVFYYRFPGILAAAVLGVYGVFLLGALAVFQAALTLPGIAGLILSIGMAVDANIIIFERIKDERNSGKTIRASVAAGFSRAYMTIFDANVTTIITAMILAYFTSGTVRGFAVTLGLGVIVSMFTAFIVTRNLIELFTATRLLQTESAFGAGRGGKK